MYNRIVCFFGLIRRTVDASRDFTSRIRPAWDLLQLIPGDVTGWSRGRAQPGSGGVAAIYPGTCCNGSGLLVLVDLLQNCGRDPGKGREKNNYIEGTLFCIKKYKKVLTDSNRRNILRSQQTNSNPGRGESEKR